MVENKKRGYKKVINLKWNSPKGERSEEIELSGDWSPWHYYN